MLTLQREHSDRAVQVEQEGSGVPPTVGAAAAHAARRGGACLGGVGPQAAGGGSAFAFQPTWLPQWRPETT